MKHSRAKLNTFTRFHLHALLLATTLPVFATIAYSASVLCGVFGAVLGTLLAALGAPDDPVGQLHRMLSHGALIMVACAWALYIALSTIGVLASRSTKTLLVVHWVALCVAAPGLTWLAARCGLLSGLV